MASFATFAGGWMLLLLLLAINLADGTRVARQASRCTGGTPCIPLSSCPALQKLLRSPSRRDLIKVREALCSTSRRSPMVCCDSSPPSPTDAPPVLTPSPPPSPSPTPPSNPGDGERLLPARCGLTSSAARIFNGEDATVGDYPWMALLGYRSSDGSSEWGCGGALINDRYVLTAAHCVLPELPLQEIRLGEHNLDTSEDCKTASRDCAPPHQSFKVTRSQIISHPTYDTRAPISDDIALIRLDRPANLNSFVHPICLPSTPQLNVRSFLGGRQAVVAGWGFTEGGSRSRILKKVKLPFVEFQQCQSVWDNILIPEQVCFGGAGGRDTCNADSGGPVFQATPSGDQYTLLGVVSFGRRECGTDPAVYTNVASYRSWILQNLRP